MHQVSFSASPATTEQLLSVLVLAPAALRLPAFPVAVTAARDARDVLDRLRISTDTGLLILSLDQPGAIELAESVMRMRDDSAALEVILLADSICADIAARAMRCRVADMLPARPSARELERAVPHALRRATARRAQAAHLRACQMEIARLRQTLAGTEPAPIQHMLKRIGYNV
jgi:DNA-binding NtrC family response regulator